MLQDGCENKTGVLCTRQVRKSTTSTMLHHARCLVSCDVSGRSLASCRRLLPLLFPPLSRLFGPRSSYTLTRVVSTASLFSCWVLSRNARRVAFRPSIFLVGLSRFSKAVGLCFFLLPLSLSLPFHFAHSFHRCALLPVCLPVCLRVHDECWLIRRHDGPQAQWSSALGPSSDPPPARHTDRRSLVLIVLLSHDSIRIHQ